MKRIIYNKRKNRILIGMGKAKVQSNIVQIGIWQKVETRPNVENEFVVRQFIKIGDNNIIPNQLDFFLDTDDRLHMKMIFRMISKDELQIHINNNKMELRPANFLIKDDGVDQLTLKRIS